MKKNKIIALLVMLMYALTFIAPVTYASTLNDVPGILEEEVIPGYPDVQEHWAEQTINKMLGQEVIAGYPDGTFKPDNSITRAEFATIIAKAFELEAKPGKVFADTEKHWAKDAISIITANGIGSGYNDKEFGPDDFITREQMTVMAVKAAKLTELINNKTFADSQDVSDWAKNFVDLAVGNDLITGYSDNTFKPKGNATRAEAAVMLYKSIPLKSSPDVTVAVNAIAVSPTTMSLIAGGATKTLKATVYPSNATNKKVTWISSDEDVATVVGGDMLYLSDTNGDVAPAAAGIVTPVNKGTATITLKSVDGGFTKTVLVTVTEATSITEEELSYFNGDSFFNGDYLNIRNQFLSSLYEEPGDIDLFELFYCGSGIAEKITDDELKVVMVKSGMTGSIENLPCPCEKNSRSNMDKILTKCMGITLADTNEVGMDNFIYIPQYDAYYHLHGDTNYRTNIKFFKGDHEGNLIRLFYNDTFLGDGNKVLTLQEKNGEYLFVSNQKVVTKVIDIGDSTVSKIQ